MSMSSALHTTTIAALAPSGPRDPALLAISGSLDDRLLALSRCTQRPNPPLGPSTSVLGPFQAKRSHGRRPPHLLGLR